MSSNVNVVGNVESAVSTPESEAGALRAFIAIIVGALLVTVVAGVLFGLGGIGFVAIVAAGLMLALCVVLTRG